MRVHVMVCTAAVLWIGQAAAQTEEWWRSMEAGMAAEQAGNFTQAVARYREGIDISAKLGANDVRRAYSWNALAKAQNVLGNYAGAEAGYRQALKAAEQSEGNTGAAYALVLQNLATLYAEGGQYSKAEKLSREALAIAAAVPAQDELGLALAQSCVATIVDLTGKHEEAIRLASSSLRILENHPAAWGPMVAALNTLAAAVAAGGDYAQAESLLLQAMGMAQQHAGTDHPMLVRVLMNLAAVAQRAGKREVAATRIRRAMEIAERRLGTDHPLYGVVLGTYARYLREDGEKSQARAMETRASQIVTDNARRNGLGSVVDATALRQK